MTKEYERVLSGEYGNRVLPFLWQKGEPREVIGEYLEKIAASDIREVCLESRPHPDFMGEGWWEDLAFIIGRCKELGLKIWLLDDAHFPTGYANGEIESKHPELRKTVLTHRTFDVVGPAPKMSIALANPFDPTERFYGAVAYRDGEHIPLDFELVRGSGAAGEASQASGADAAYFGSASVGASPDRLVFDVPEGHIKLVLLFTSRKSGFRDDYINMVDRDSCRVLIDAVYEPHFQRFGDEFGKTILGFFTDEPGFMNAKGAVDASGNADSLIGASDMPLPWSDELERRLEVEFGEGRLLDQLARLWDRDASGARARHAYMDAATRLYRSCFDEQLGDWCRERGVMHIGHVIEDKDCHARLGVGAGHYFRAVGGQDMAGVDIVINQLVPGVDEGFHSYGRGKWDMEFFNYALPRLGSSAAHLDPKKRGRCMAEVFGAFGWHEGLKEMKWIADHFLVRGVNWFVPHAFSQAPFPDPDCPPHFYAHGENPQFRHFGKLMGYMNRMGTLLSDGEAHTEAAVLYHADAEWAGEAMPVQKAARELTRSQIGFDFVPADAFLSDGDEGRYTVEFLPDGMGFAVNGQRYRCLVLPSAEFIGADTLAFVERAIEAGIGVYAVDALPAKVYDGADAGGAAAGEAGPNAAGWVPVDPALLEGVRVVSLEDLADTLISDGVREVEVEGYQPWLRLYRYSRKGEEYLFLVNEHPRKELHAQLSGADGVALDLLNLTAPRAFDGVLDLAPSESILVALGEELSDGADGNGAGAGAGLAVGADAIGAAATSIGRISLDGGWTVAYATSTGYPAFGDPLSIEKLVDLSTGLFPDASGTFRYERSFELVSAAAAAVLDIEDAYETVEVFVDGASAGVRIAPPYRLPLGALGPGMHRLAIEVTNTLDKQVTDMFSLTEASEPSGIVGAVALELIG